MVLQGKKKGKTYALFVEKEYSVMKNCFVALIMKIAATVFMEAFHQRKLRKLTNQNLLPNHQTSNLDLYEGRYETLTT